MHRVFVCGSVMKNPASSPKTSQAPRTAASLPRKAIPPSPPGHRLVTPFEGPSGRDLARPAFVHQERGPALDRVGQVETPDDHCFHRAQWLVFPAVRGRPLGQLRLQLGNLLPTQPRQRCRPLWPQNPQTTLVPHLPPSLHQTDTDPQSLRDHQARLALGKPLNDLQPELPAELLPCGGQPTPTDTTHPRHGIGRVTVFRIKAEAKEA